MVYFAKKNIFDQNGPKFQKYPYFFIFKKMKNMIN